MIDETEKFLEICKKCDAFFKEALDEAIKNQHIQVSEEVAAYLLWLLVLGLRVDPHFNSEPLIQRYINSLTGEGSEIFRDIGDLALMITGIWPESLLKKLIDPDYYVRIGSLAYKKESEANRVFDRLFQELSENFVKCADILIETTHFFSKEKPAHSDIIKIYERWLQTHNPFLEEKLRSYGINPINIKAPKQ